MAATPSAMLPLGTPLPSFSLPDAVSGRLVSSAEAQGKPALVMFICNHCPYVVHVRDELTRIAREYGEKGVFVAGINANSLRTHPQDGPDAMKTLAEDLGWRFPFLFDETQAVARAFDAQCTPDFFLFAADGRLAYRGQLDDSRPHNGKPVTGQDLRRALDAVLRGESVPGEQRPSIGCNIKWDPR